MIEEILKKIHDELVEIKTLLAANAAGGGKTEEPEDDLTGEAPPADAKKKITQTDIVDAIREAVTAGKRAEVKKLFAKFGAERGTDVKEKDFEKFMAAIAKI